MTLHAVVAVISGVVLASSYAFAANETVPNPPALVSQIRVQPDKAPDCSSLKAIAESVTRGCKTNDAKAIAIYNFMQLAHYHRAYPTEPGGLPALKEINSYGWSLCGGLHTIQAALWRQLGWEWRFVVWDGHETAEAKYDGRWHYLDAFLKVYAWMPDGKGGQTIAGEDDLAANPKELLTDAFVMDEAKHVFYAKGDACAMINGIANWRAHDFFSCGDTIEGTIEGLKTRKNSGPLEAWMGITHSDGGYSTDVNLAPGFTLTNSWDAVPDAWYWGDEKIAPAHTCGGHKDTRNDPGYGLVLEPYINSKPARGYANGTLTFAPDFSSAAVLQSFVSAENVKADANSLVPAEAGKPAVVTLRLASPYVMTQARGVAAGADAVELSTDNGQTFTAVKLDDFSASVRGKYAALLRITFAVALKGLKVDVVVQNNSGALPYLSPGKNTIAVAVADPANLGENTLVVTYAYRLGSRAQSLEQLCAQGKPLAKQIDATWSEKITYARKTFTARDLPATFEIDCPTPKGRFPIYPRMLYVQRQVLAPGATPLPLPDGAVEARGAGADEESTALPNPFLVGTDAPQR